MLIEIYSPVVAMSLYNIALHGIHPGPTYIYPGPTYIYPGPTYIYPGVVHCLIADCLLGFILIPLMTILADYSFIRNND